MDHLLAHMAGTAEPIVYKLYSQGWRFKLDTWMDRHKNEEISVVLFKSPKMKTYSVMLAREWHNFTEKYILKREKDAL